MTHDLAIGNRSTCSWSLRGWLLFEKFNLPVNIRSERIRSDAYRAMMADFAPARSVPAARLDGVVVYDGTIASLRRFKEDQQQVQAGYECGIGLANFRDIKEGDTIESYEVKRVART